MTDSNSRLILAQSAWSCSTDVRGIPLRFQFDSVRIFLSLDYCGHQKSIDHRIKLDTNLLLLLLFFFCLPLVTSQNTRVVGIIEIQDWHGLIVVLRSVLYLSNITIMHLQLYQKICSLRWSDCYIPFKGII